jgi:hypothetical protein
VVGGAVPALELYANGRADILAMFEVVATGKVICVANGGFVAVTRLLVLGLRIIIDCDTGELADTGVFVNVIFPAFV